ncbi:TetR/AcrR family transcriptional regulator [Trinickia terrae]|nr:TetR/AcrR family transcriptional regulator [Trinickia terrae]
MVKNAVLPVEAEQERARSRIIAAAQEIFSVVGFDGASLRQIAERAEVQHQLVIYHFKNKETLWKEAISAIFEDMDSRFRRRLEGLDGVDPGTVLRLMIRDFVQFAASHPEFHRIMTMEGRSDNARMRWLLKTHVQAYYELLTTLIRQAQDAGVVRAGAPGQLYYALLGLITTAFALAPEYQLMTRIDPFAAEHVEQIFALACDFLFMSKKGS